MMPHRKGTLMTDLTEELVWNLVDGLDEILANEKMTFGKCWTAACAGVW